MTEIFLSDDIKVLQANMTDQEIFERNIKWLKECDVLVSEVSGSSFGIGYEIGYVLNGLNKKAFVLNLPDEILTFKQLESPSHWSYAHIE